jgi:hypothetical protein
MGTTSQLTRLMNDAEARVQRTGHARINTPNSFLRAIHNTHNASNNRTTYYYYHYYYYHVQRIFATLFYPLISIDLMTFPPVKGIAYGASAIPKQRH